MKGRKVRGKLNFSLNNQTRYVGRKRILRWGESFDFDVWTSVPMVEGYGNIRQSEIPPEFPQ